MIVHATSVAWRLGKEWRAALLFGESGQGKSDLALRALAIGWRLVSDDYTLVWPSDGRLWARAPDPIADRIEARGLGLLSAPRLSVAEACLAVVCDEAEGERLPPDESMTLEGLTLPSVRLQPFQASALTKLQHALSTRSTYGRLEPGEERPI